MNEFDFINRVIKGNPSDFADRGVGDDCSAVPWGRKHLLIQSSDLMLEGVHFSLGRISFEDLAYKALAVNISDVAAMGGRPLWVHLSLGVPSKVDETSLEAFFKSFKKEARRQGVHLVGGDLSRSTHDLVINVSISGIVKKKSVQYRHDFVKADLLCVTGSLGDSGLGLWSLQKNVEHPRAMALVQRHHRPPIEWTKAQFLAKHKGVYGMMDLSDGLWSDLQRLEGVDYQVRVQDIPLSLEAQEFCHDLHLNPYDFAVSGGEDYRLLFGVREKYFSQISHAFESKFGEKIFPIGYIAPKSKDQKSNYLLQGKVWQPTRKSFSHFSGAND